MENVVQCWFQLFVSGWMLRVVLFALVITIGLVGVLSKLVGANPRTELSLYDTNVWLH